MGHAQQQGVGQHRTDDIFNYTHALTKMRLTGKGEDIP